MGCLRQEQKPKFFPKTERRREQVRILLRLMGPREISGCPYAWVARSSQVACVLERSGGSNGFSCDRFIGASLQRTDARRVFSAGYPVAAMVCGGCRAH